MKASATSLEDPFKLGVSRAANSAESIRTPTNKPRSKQTETSS